jgi:hypothetical protein
MKKEIAKTDYYTIEVDKTKNRIYYTPIGFWRNGSVVPNYLSDIQKALNAVTPGFTFLADVRALKIPPQEVQALFKQAQEKAKAAGLSKTAEVLPKSLLRLAVERTSKETKIQRQGFATIKDAEVWLNK